MRCEAVAKQGTQCRNEALPGSNCCQVHSQELETDSSNTEPPKPTPKGAELRKLAPGELERILEAHGKWVESDGKEGERAELSRSDLQGAMLIGTNLQGAGLGRANLQKANLQVAKLQDANLQGADLGGVRSLTQHQINEACGDTRTKLPGDLSIKLCPGLELPGADLRNFAGLTQEQLDTVCGDENTKLPDGLTIKTCPEE